MSLPTTPLAYEDAYERMDQALGDPKGIRIKMPDRDTAMHFRMRCHQARKIDRDQNTATYPKGNPLHGASHYDKLCLTIKQDDDAIYLHMEKREAPGLVESLSGSKPLRVGGYQRPEPTAPQAPPATDEVLGEAFEQVPVASVRRV